MNNMNDFLSDTEVCPFLLFCAWLYSSRQEGGRGIALVIDV